MMLRLYRSNIDIIPRLEISHNGGSSSLTLTLPNHSDFRVWADEAAFTLTELDSAVERSDTTVTAEHPIRQPIEPHESLELSLTQAVYEAVGRPQGNYSCIIFATIRFRSGDHQFERTAQQRRLQMQGLVPISLR